MKIIYFLFIVLVLIYFIGIPLLFNQNKISVSELLTFLGILPLSLIAIFQKQFERWFFAPKLILYFKMQEPYCSKTPFYITLPTPIQGQNAIATEGYGFRFGVRNIGKTQAKLCEVFMAELKELKNNNWANVEYFQQVPLQWDRGKPGIQYTDINPSPVEILCDIGHVIKKTDKMFPEETDKFFLSQVYTVGGYQKRYLEPNKRYKFKIVITAENASSIEEDFELHWTGNWKDNYEEMFKEVNIKKI